MTTETLHRRRSDAQADTPSPIGKRTFLRRKAPLPLWLTGAVLRAAFALTVSVALVLFFAILSLAQWARHEA